MIDYRGSRQDFRLRFMCFYYSGHVHGEFCSRCYGWVTKYSFPRLRIKTNDFLRANFTLIDTSKSKSEQRIFELNDSFHELFLNRIKSIIFFKWLLASSIIKFLWCIYPDLWLLITSPRAVHAMLINRIKRKNKVKLYSFLRSIILMRSIPLTLFMSKVSFSHFPKEQASCFISMSDNCKCIPSQDIHTFSCCPWWINRHAFCILLTLLEKHSNKVHKDPVAHMDCIFLPRSFVDVQKHIFHWTFARFANSNTAMHRLLADLFLDLSANMDNWGRRKNSCKKKIVNYEWNNCSFFLSESKRRL